jgi:flagellar biogenesis protein FliO
MARTLQFKRYNNATLANTVGANGELIINTTNSRLTVHNGTTSGGSALATVSDLSSTSDSYARTTANSATVLAQNAYNHANTIVSDTQIDPVARNTSNTASNNITIIQGVNDGQNTRMTIAEGVDVGQNTRMTIIEGVNTDQNTRMTIAEGVDVSQNTRMTIIEGVNTTQNTNISIANNAGQAAFVQANTTAGGLTTANSNITIIQGVDTSQNTRLTIAEGVDVGQNTRMTIIEGVDATQNTNITAAAQTVPQNAQTSNYTLQLTDAGKHIFYTQGTGTTLYIPPASEVSFPTGATIMIVSQTTSSASVTITANAGVSLYFAGSATNGSRSISSYGMATLIKVATNTWFINGTGVV